MMSTKRLMRSAVWFVVVSWATALSVVCDADHSGHGVLVHKASPSLKVSRAWSPIAPPTMKMNAGYLTVTNSGDAPLELVSVSSPHYKSVEIHLSVMEQGISRMEKVPSIEIDAHQSLEFVPGGLHLMMHQPVATPKLGDQFRLQLNFTNGDSHEFLMDVVDVGPVDLTHHHHH